MRVISSIKEMQAWAKQARRRGQSIGFVPTMGYLHQGHLSLMRRARQENDYLVISIFVNPAQFGPQEDFRRYPRDLARDKKLAKLCGTDVLFHPRTRSVFPRDYKTYVNVQGLSHHLCGKSRPGHFRGVATVVLKLFNIVQATVAYFGQKDAQQAIIIRQMVRDLNLPLKIKVLPIVREKDGLAMSSRNIYLNPEQRRQAKILYNALQVSVGMIKSGIRDVRKITAQIRKMIELTRAAQIDYIKIVDAVELNELKKVKGRTLIALAVFFGRTRLIDNTVIRV